MAVASPAGLSLAMAGPALHPHADALGSSAHWLPFSGQIRRLHVAAAAWTLRNVRSGLPADDAMLALVSPEAFWLLRSWRRENFGAQEALSDALDETRRQILALATEEGVESLRGAQVSVRAKGLWSTFVKATVREKAVHDVLAVRVVLKGDDEGACYEALEAIHAHWPSVGGRFKDYARFPKPNGYRGLHDTLRLPSGQLFELQIRTEGQHREAEWGTAAHRRYKGAPLELSQTVFSGLASGLASTGNPKLRWPLQPHIALTLAARIAAR